MAELPRLQTGRSINEHLEQQIEDNGWSDKVAQTYYEGTTTFDGMLDDRNRFARSAKQLQDGESQAMAVATLPHPINHIVPLAQELQDQLTLAINHTEVRDHPETFGELNIATLVISGPLHEIARGGLERIVEANSMARAYGKKEPYNFKRVIVVPLSEGIGSKRDGEKELIEDIRTRQGDLKTRIVPSWLMMRELEKGYRAKGFDPVKGVEYVNLGDFMRASDGDTSPVLHISHPENPLSYLQTSGTTGKPKTISKSAEDFAEAFNTYMSIKGLTIEPDDKSANVYPGFPSTIDAWNKITLMAGIEQVINPMAVFNGKFDQYIFDKLITMITVNPHHLRPFLNTKLKAGSLSHLRIPGVGGEFVPLSYAQALNEVFQYLGMLNALMVCYGFTEGPPATNVGIVPFTNYDPRVANVAGPSIGFSRPRIIGLDGRELSKGQRGLIEVKPSSEPSPYLGEQEKWDSVHTGDGYYQTGDVGRILEHNGEDLLDVHGRGTDIIIGPDGEEYYKFDIDKAVDGASQNVARAVTVELTTSAEREESDIVVYVELGPGKKGKAKATLRALIEQAEANLELGARPLAYGFIDEFQFNEKFKTDISKLESQQGPFYTIKDGELMQVDFQDDGEIDVKPVSKIKNIKL
jgi:acyl-coenzyme A synthetase/AMP-(fatty) acid ligase